MNRRIVCAAVRHPTTGRIVCGPRHLDKTMWCQIVGCTMDEFNAMCQRGDVLPEECKVWGWQGEQGFVDQHGVFLTREEAWHIALERGQVLRDKDVHVGRLHSEHLY